LYLQFPSLSVPITTSVASSNPNLGEVYSIQQYVIQFVSDMLRHVVNFPRVLRFPPPIKLTAMIEFYRVRQSCLATAHQRPLLTTTIRLRQKHSPNYLIQCRFSISILHTFSIFCSILRIPSIPCTILVPNLIRKNR
jgi:hypothetical protein